MPIAASKLAAIIVTAVTLGSVCFIGTSAYILREARQQQIARATDAGVSLLAALENDISQNVRAIDLSLQRVAERLHYPGLAELEPALQHALLFDRSAAARHVGAIIVLDEAGYVRYDSRTLKPARLNLADRDYFSVHKDSATVGLFIGYPQISKTTHEWFVGVSRRLSNPDGSFAGVAIASLRLAYFKDLFRISRLVPVPV
jgi:hypothetical protein